MRYFVSLGLVLASIFSAPVVAQSVIPVRCDSCRLDSDFMFAAEGRGPGNYYVYNVPLNKIQRWTVYSRTPPGGQPYSVGGNLSVQQSGQNNRALQVGIRQPTQGNVPNAPKAELDIGHRLYVANGNTLRPVYVAPIGELGLPHLEQLTIFDLINDRNMEGQIESAAGDPQFISKFTNRNILSAARDLLNIGTTYLGLKDQATMIIRVVDTEGSYIDVHVKYDEVIGQVQRKSARTASGQIIPTDIQDANGRWQNLGPDNLERLADHLERLGANVEHVTSGGGTAAGSGSGGMITGIVCTSTSCKVTRLPR